MADEIPNDLDCEAQVLGACLVSSDALDEAAERLDPGDFYAPKNALLYRAILNEREHGNVDAASVVADGWDRSDLISLAVDSAPSAQGRLVERLRDLATRRRVIGSCAEVSALAYSEPAETVLSALLTAAEQASGRNHGATLHDGTGALLGLLASNEDKGHVSTGFHDLDNILVGFKPSTLTILGARPSVGKSALALHFALQAAKRETCLFFSLEMSLVELGQRIASMLTTVPADRLRRRDLTLDDANAIEALAPRLGRLLVDDDPVLRMADIRSRARRVQRRRGLGLVVIDYLQLMTGRRTENRQVEVADLSRALKLLSKELDVPVIALSQLSRGMESEKRRPRLSDLRESGALEQDADVVLLLSRDENGADLHVAKSRNGPIGHVPLMFEHERARFVSPMIDSAGRVS